MARERYHQGERVSVIDVPSGFVRSEVVSAPVRVSGFECFARMSPTLRRGRRWAGFAEHRTLCEPCGAVTLAVQLFMLLAALARRAKSPTPATFFASRLRLVVGQEDQP